MWRRGCYEVSQKEKYKINIYQDEEECDLTSDEDRSRHLVARNEDHLIIPFQCELCHFRNLKGDNHSQRRDNILLIRMIRRVNIDAF